jgi:uncharacterized protein YkwD
MAEDSYRAAPALRYILLVFGAWFAGAPIVAVTADVSAEAIAGALSRYAASCGVRVNVASRWHADRRLDEAAASWAQGASLHDAIEGSGYTASAASGIHIENASAERGSTPGASTCRALRNEVLGDAGMHARGDDVWFVLAAPIDLPVAGEDARVDAQALVLVNQVRAEPQQCGSRAMPPAAPLRLSVQLNEAAGEHARDMAQHHYFEHRDRNGRTSADRVRATGYAEQRVGENIAYGALSTRDAIAGWLKSPGHCENLMDPDFQQMGIAFAREQGANTHVYWVQVLAAPKAARH